MARTTTSDYIDRDPQRVRCWDYDHLPGWELSADDHGVVTPSTVETAAQRVRRLRAQAQATIAAIRDAREEATDDSTADRRGDARE